LSLPAALGFSSDVTINCSYCKVARSCWNCENRFTYNIAKYTGSKN